MHAATQGATATDESKRRALATSVGLFVLAALLRLAYVASVSASPSVRYPMVDSRAYYERALGVLAGDWLGDRVAFQAPTYPYLLAAVYSVFGVDSLAVPVLQALLDATTVVGIYLVARRILDERMALVAGLIAAAYKVSFFYDALLLKPALAMFLVTLTLLLALRADESPSSRRWGAAGAVLGFAIGIRGNFLLFVPILLGWIALRPGPVTGRLRAIAAVSAGIVLFVAPLTLRNYVVGDDFVLTTSQAGVNFFLGNYRGNDSGRYSSPAFLKPLPVSEERLFEMEVERRTGKNLKPSEQSRFWFREGLLEIAADPGHFVRHTAKKVDLYLNHYEIPDNQSYEFFAEHIAPMLRWPLATWGMVVPLAIVGLFHLPRRRGSVLLVLMLATYSASVVLFYIMSRYRMPAVPFVIVLAAAGLVGTFDALRERRLVPALASVAALALLFPLVHRDISSDDYSVIRANIGVHLLHRVEKLRDAAARLAASGDLASAAAREEDANALEREAEEQLRLGVEIAPQNLVIQRRLLGLLVERIERLHSDGHHEDALVRARELVEGYPRLVEGHLLLGLSQQALGRSEAARRSLERVLIIEPGQVRATEALQELETGVSTRRLDGGDRAQGPQGSSS